MKNFLKKIDSFNLEERENALDALIKRKNGISMEVGTNVNMHIHSFFSYNIKGFSPSHIAWNARIHGLFAAGLCDFDVLDGLDEFINAGILLELRTIVSLETRAYLKEYEHKELSSPGEPGIIYIMGSGFAKKPLDDSYQGYKLDSYRERAGLRNKSLIDRINSKLPEIAIDYEQDVLPLVPRNYATERHIVKSYIKKAYNNYSNSEQLIEFWSAVLNEKKSKIIELFKDHSLFEEFVRSGLVKRGGIGYKQPSMDTFPLADDFIEWVILCNAIPMLAWLDGTSDGEKNGKTLLECVKEKGVAAINIIPERNWNITDSRERSIKEANLADIVKTADNMGFPINIGTEMNKEGLPFVNDLNVEPLKQYRNTFLKGACIMVGHTILSKYADFSYSGEKAKAEFRDVFSMNKFFKTVGNLLPVNISLADKLREMGKEKALTWFFDKVRG